jgi:hypothetical protein
LPGNEGVAHARRSGLNDLDDAFDRFRAGQEEARHVLVFEPHPAVYEVSTA